MSAPTWKESNEYERVIWELKGALGYSVPGDTPDNTFHCGLCEAKDRILIRALRRYGRCLPSCERVRLEDLPSDKCTCGFREITKEPNA
jgi:hypothetical protein